MSVAALMLAARSLPLAPGAPVMNFAAVSVSNVLATTCQYEALKYVTFPVQTLGKCAKMVPVMIWGRLISGKKYTFDDYAVAVAVMLGCTAFLLSGETKSRVSAGRDDALTSILGLGLMAGYLGFDGFTSTFQDKLFKGYQMETYNQMLWVNSWSAIIALVSSAADSSLFQALAFVQRHPESLKDMLVLSLAATIGQLIILYTIKEFGALLFATVMTTRQFLSILLSSIVYLHPLSLTQWAGTVTVFSALYYQSFVKKSKQQQQQGDSSQQQLDTGRKSASHETSAKEGDEEAPNGTQDSYADGGKPASQETSNPEAPELPASTTSKPSNTPA